MQLVQVTRHRLALGIVLVHHPPAVTHVPAVHAIGVGLLLVEHLPARHPLDLRERATGVVTEETEVRLLGQFAPVSIRVVMRHQPGKRIAAARIDLLKIQRLVVATGLHEQPQIRTTTHRRRHVPGTAAGRLELGVLLECQLPLTRHPLPPEPGYFFFVFVFFVFFVFFVLVFSGVSGFGGSPSDQTAFSKANTSGSNSFNSARTNG